jgi:hypothetical protein
MARTYQVGDFVLACTDDVVGLIPFDGVDPSYFENFEKKASLLLC